MKMKRIIPAALFLLAGTVIFAQAEIGESTSQNVVSEAVTGGIDPNYVQLAMSSPDYRVTAGDVYTLAFAAGNTPVTYRITVDSTYRIRVSNLAVIDASGKTFNQLKTQVEDIVSRNYTMSGVQFVLSAPALFTIQIKGEVARAGERSAWALQRLSAFAAGNNLTAYSSLRDVAVTSASGKTTAYDLFKASRFGDLSQDPYVRPGDVITVNRVDRAVTIGGAVERPGRYQLLPGENLSELVAYYGNGLTVFADTGRISLVRHTNSQSVSGDRLLLTAKDVENNYELKNYDEITIPAINDRRPVATVDRIERRITLAGAVRRPGTYDLGENENLKDLIVIYGDGITPVADTSRIELIRLVDSKEASGDKLNLTQADIENDYILQNMDIITVPDITRLRPVMFLEGAISEPVVEGTSSAAGSRRMSITFEYGEDYGSLVRRNRTHLSVLADFANASILRNGAHIALNLTPLLLGDDSQNAQQVVENDTLVIPFYKQSLGFSQSGSAANASVTAASAAVTSGVNPQNVQLAMSSPDYPVTPGDMYTLAYAAGSDSVTYSIEVDTTCQVRVANLDIVDATGKTFNQLKTQVERIVSDNYPLGGVQLALAAPALFIIQIKGEVDRAGERSAWALQRLSAFAAGDNLTAYSSLRDVAVTSASGRTAVYDLFKASRFGDLSQDPYVRPGDVITVNHVDRAVTIAGAVERPGRYQLLPGENLSELAAYYGNGLTVFADTGRIALVRHTNSQSVSGDRLLLTTKDVESNYELKNYDEITIPAINERRPVATVDRIERRITLAGAVRRPGTYDLGANENLKDLIVIYGDGITPVADTSRIELVRIVDSKAESGDKLYLTQADIAANYDLQHMDVITIPVITDLLPVMFVEGAVLAFADAALEASTRLTVRFTMGENYATLVQRNRPWFSAVSDTQNAYIIRGGARIPLNLNPMLYDSSYRSEYAVETNDTLIIPFRQYFISVAGAVNTPGRYPYIPDRDWEYYIGLAGGFNPDRNSLESIFIRNIDGKRLKKTDPITPETTITAHTNSFLYSFNRWAPIVTTVLSIVTSFLTVMAVTEAL